MGKRSISTIAVVICGVVVAAIYLVSISGPLNNSDEFIYAEFIRQMQRSGDYLTLRYQGVELLQRPPTTLALYAWVGHVVPNEFGLRVVPVGFTLATALLIAWVGYRWFESVAIAVFTGLFFCAIPTVFDFGRLLMTDPPFVFVCTLALVSTIRAQAQPSALLWAGLGLGLAFATKSFAAAFPAVALFPWLVAAAWRHRKAGGIRRRVLLSLAVFLATALPYYLYSFATYGGRFYREHIERILFDRASGQLESVVGQGGAGFYLEQLWSSDGVVFAAAIVAGLGYVVVSGWQSRDRKRLALATYLLFVFAGLSIVGTRLPHYLLIWYPAAALAVGVGVFTIVTACRRPALAYSVPIIGVVALVHTAGSPATNSAIEPAHATARLGTQANKVIPAGQPVYTLNWYAPVLGYYADRNWVLLSTRTGGQSDGQPHPVSRALRNTAPFRYTQNIVDVPSWPQGPLFVAGFRDEVMRLPFANKQTLVADDTGLVLVRLSPGDDERL